MSCPCLLGVSAIDPIQVCYHPLLKLELDELELDELELELELELKLELELELKVELELELERIVAPGIVYIYDNCVYNMNTYKKYNWMLSKQINININIPSPSGAVCVTRVILQPEQGAFT